MTSRAEEAPARVSQPSPSPSHPPGGSGPPRISWRRVLAGAAVGLPTSAILLVLSRRHLAALGVLGVEHTRAFAFSLLMHGAWFVPTTFAGAALALRKLLPALAGAPRPSVPP